MRKLAFLLALITLPAYAGTAFFKYERITGMTKQCVNDYLGNEYTITIDVAELCPMTIEV